MPFSSALPAHSSWSRHRSGCPDDWIIANDKRPFDLGRQLGHPVEFPHRRLGGTLTGHALRSHFEDRTAACGHRPAQAEQFLFGGVRSGHRLAANGTVALGARRRESKCPCFDGLLDDPGHDLVAMSSSVASSLRAPRSPIA